MKKKERKKEKKKEKKEKNERVEREEGRYLTRDIERAWSALGTAGLSHWKAKAGKRRRIDQ